MLMKDAVLDENRWGKYANPPFDPCLGVGEDADLISRLRRLGFNRYS